MGGTEDDSRELCFPRKCLPFSRVRADAVFLPHLSSPLPVPLRVLVPGWCFLVAAAAVSMCVTDPESSAAGGPLPALRLTRWAVELARVPPVSLTRGGARLVASQSSSAPRDSADRLGCPLLPAPPRPEAVVQKWLGSHGLGEEWRFCLFYLHHSPRFPCLLGKPVSQLNAKRARPLRTEQSWAKSSVSSQKQQLQLWGQKNFGRWAPSPT